MTEPRKTWLVMGFNSYGRENYVVGEYATEAEAKRVVEVAQAQPNADHMWIVAPDD
jgi:hypothetical protein